jgi:RNA polymerase sigma-70 factor (ECF subfamily)
MNVTTSAGSAAQRFEALFDTYSPRVFLYVCRHTERSMVEDVVSETFLVAWRRLREVPDEPLPWLLVVARNVLANQRRALSRGERCVGDVSALDRLISNDATVEDLVVARATMLSALRALRPSEREALLLIAWDGLSTAEAARVVGCSPRTFTVRLHRARRLLCCAVERASEPPNDKPAPLLKETT